MRVTSPIAGMALLIAVPAVSFWAASRRSADSDTAAPRVQPASVEPVAGSEVRRVVLSPAAVERLGIATATVVGADGSPATTADARMASDLVGRGGRRTVVPYSALLYDSQGNVWVYTNPEPNTFVRHRVVIDHIDGDDAVLTDGPPIGTEVVTVGGAELLGAELEVGR